MNSSPLFFSPWKQIYRVGVGVGRSPGGPRGRGHAQGGRRTPTPVDRVWAPGLDSFAGIFIDSKNILCEVLGHSKNFYFCTNITMAILLKTTPIRVSSIQIMQVRVPNKGKCVWKSRYVGDVSTPPSLNPCLSSSNSVDKLKEKKKNFHKLCLLLLL